MRLNLRQIEAFRAVFQTNSMTVAADLMGVTQPAVSRLIRDLEAEIDIRLFERTRGGLLATAEAISLYREVQRSFHGLDRIARAASELGRNRSGLLNVAASGGPAFYGLPEVIKRFSDRWPGIRLSLTVLQSSDILDSVARQQYDFGIADVPSEAPGVDVVSLPPLDFVCAIPAGHPLAKKRKIRPRDLRGEPMLMVSHASHQHQRIIQALSTLDQPLDIVFEASNSGPLGALVVEGMGIAILDPITASAHESKAVVIRPFEPAIRYDLRMIYPAKQPRSDAAKAFAAMVEEKLKNL